MTNTKLFAKQIKTWDSKTINKTITDYQGRMLDAARDQMPTTWYATRIKQLSKEIKNRKK